MSVCRDVAPTGSGGGGVAMAVGIGVGLGVGFGGGCVGAATRLGGGGANGELVVEAAKSTGSVTVAGLGAATDRLCSTENDNENLQIAFPK